VLATIEKTTVLDASNYIDPKDSVVASAVMLADAVVDALVTREAVIVDLRGLRSVSSSYFNMLLSCVARRSGIEAVRTRLGFEFSSMAQKSIFDRSFDAVLRSFEA